MSQFVFPEELCRKVVDMQAAISQTSCVFRGTMFVVFNNKTHGVMPREGVDVQFRRVEFPYECPKTSANQDGIVATFQDHVNELGNQTIYPVICIYQFQDLLSVLKRIP